MTGTHTEPLSMAGFHLNFLSKILLFVASGSPVVSGQSTGELSTVVCSKS